MAIDTSAVLAVISEGQAATVAVALAVAVAWWSLRASKLLRDDGQEYADDEDFGDDLGYTFESVDVACSECDEPMAFASWEETGGICIHCGAPGGDWFMAPMECEVCGVELPALVDDEAGDHHRIGDRGETLCPACAGDERV